MLEVLLDCKVINMNTQLKRLAVHVSKYIQKDKYTKIKVMTQSWRKDRKTQKRAFLLCRTVDQRIEQRGERNRSSTVSDFSFMSLLFLEVLFF